MHILNNIWTIWLHLSNDTDWTISSYKKVFTFDTLEDCITLLENVDKEIVEKCMLFMMRDNIKPIWEDPANNKGGCFSYKVLNNDIYKVWKTLNYHLIGQTLSEDENLLNNITGISISPKKNFSIIKLWLANVENIKNNKNIYDFIINQKNETNKSNEYLVSDYRDPFNIHELCDIEKLNCVYKNHDLLY